MKNNELSQDFALHDLYKIFCLECVTQTGKYVVGAEDLPRASKVLCAQRPIKRAEFEKCT